MHSYAEVLLYTFIAGGAIPAGGFLAYVNVIHPSWLGSEARHGITAFGGGALLAAVALVLVPESMRVLSAPALGAAFLVGALAFMMLDRTVATQTGPGPQMIAMLADFLPEAVALGAAFAQGNPAGPLLALLIAMQNLPEGFNAFGELKRSSSPRHALSVMTALALLGPVAALIGLTLLADRPTTVAVLMAVAAAGILYLTFQDIAPKAKMTRHWIPPIGAVGGFLLGVLGQMWLVG